MRINRFLITFLAPVLLLLSGCATLTDGDKRNDFAANLAIQYGTLKVIDENANPYGAAQEIVKLANKIEKFIDGGTSVTIALAVDELEKEIPWHTLDVADTLLVRNLLDILVIELEARINKGIIDQDTVVVVRQIIKVVRDTAASML